ncbi:MAG: CapA family protein [Lentisphaeria bacterium]|nr:CapA family protein [Lentisphaeria bacterium]
MLKIDWKNGCACDGAKVACKNIVITGDWDPCWDAVDVSIYDELMAKEPEKCYGGTLDVIRGADMRIVNLECVINGKTPVLKGGPHLSAAERHLPSLCAPGFQVAALANNHTCDYGAEGMRETFRALDKLGIRYFGAGFDDDEAWKPLEYDLDGIRVGLVNFTEGHDLCAASPGKFGVAGWDVERAKSSIRELKKRCDIVIVIPHGGIEFVAYPAKYCIDTYRALAAEKPDAIVAHHPHVPQGLEIVDGVPIFYSLGNFMFYMGKPAFYGSKELYYRNHGYLVELEVAKDGVHGFRLHPYRMTAHGLELPEGAARDEFLATLKRLSDDLAPDPYAGFHAVLKEYWNRGYPAWHFNQVMEAFKNDPPYGAALMRNRMTTLQHTQLYLPMFERVVRGTIDDAPDRMLEMAKEYVTRTM